MKLREYITNNNRYNNCKKCNRVITNRRYKMYNRCYWNGRTNISNNQSIKNDTNIEYYYSRNNTIKHIGYVNQIKDINCVRLFCANP